VSRDLATGIEATLYTDFTYFSIYGEALAIVPVPEPSTALLFASGVVGLAARRRRARGASLG
jgi:hypothetical protein